MILKGNNVHFSAQETPGEKFPQICSLKKLSSSVVSGKPNSDYKLLYSSLLLNQHDFRRNNVRFSAQETPAKKKLIQCSLKKLSSPVFSGKPNNSNYRVSIFPDNNLFIFIC